MDKMLLTIDSSEAVLGMPVQPQTLSVGKVVINLETGAVSYPDSADAAAREFWDAVERYVLGVK